VSVQPARESAPSDVGSAPAAGPAEPPLARVIALLLVGGVALSAAIVILGMTLLAVTGRTGYHEALEPGLILAREGSIMLPRTVGEVWQGVVALRPFAVIELGVVLLILTPILRVAASIVLFWWEGDRLYAGIATALLALLLISVTLVT